MIFPIADQNPVASTQTQLHDSTISSFECDYPCWYPNFVLSSLGHALTSVVFCGGLVGIVPKCSVSLAIIEF